MKKKEATNQPTDPFSKLEQSLGTSQHLGLVGIWPSEEQAIDLCWWLAANQTLFGMVVGDTSNRGARGVEHVL